MWFAKFLVLLAFTTGIALLGTAIARRRARRTIASWFGRGVNRELGPADVAILLGVHPSAVVAHLFFELAERGRARLVSTRPLRAEWVAGAPGGEVETAFRGALDAGGGFDRDGVFALLQAAWRRLDDAMIAFSGRATAVYYRELLEEMVRETRDRGRPDPALLRWLLVRDVLDYWDDLEEGPEREEFAARLRELGAFREHLLGAEEYLAEARRAPEGYFRYLPRTVNPSFIPNRALLYR